MAGSAAGGQGGGAPTWRTRALDELWVGAQNPFGDRFGPQGVPYALGPDVRHDLDALVDQPDGRRGRLCLRRAHRRETQASA